jgi:hypothetical protein
MKKIIVKALATFYFLGICIFGNSQILFSEKAYLPTSGKVAFIGNSLTMLNGGTDLVVKKLGDALPTSLILTIDQSIQHYGYTLKDHWTDLNRSVIRNGKFNMVVIQEGGDWTYSTDPNHASQFYQYAKMWSDTIRKAGATPVLYMMWAWSTDTGVQIEKITDFQAAQYDSAARLINARVIPIGRGYYKLRTDTSAVARSINLFVDYQHPSACGTYFIGCIAFASLYNISPVGNPYIGEGTDCQSSLLPTKLQAIYLQKLAWETWLEYGGDDSGRGYVPLVNQNY